MAQVWLTFEEIQEFFGCDAAEARRRVIANQWERRRCTDGLFRAELPADVAHDYMLRYRGERQVQEDFDADDEFPPANGFEAAMAALRQVFAEEPPLDVLPQAPAVSATVRHVSFVRTPARLLAGTCPTPSQGTLPSTLPGIWPRGLGMPMGKGPAVTAIAAQR